MSGELKKIWIKRMKRGPMDNVNEAVLIEGKGIETNANQGGKRQVTILEQEVWDELMEDLGTSLDPSLRRANLLVSGVQLENSRNKILQIGTCTIQIYGETKPCERMDEVFPGLKNEMYPKWRGGAYGKIIKGGTIQVGDTVELIETKNKII
ncbi:MOSC domain-containing protein [Evansella tamaricis]|uniref:MOSC domain-containing protein n=1 Tax=Evansella tamaricis TaxID=2069301 RepID=A0ABS6JKE5_9BACI|nr:MOSC domain-containing protein [Evansella tamaricis]MBU9714056.1 MOSC domain-containing protein [Evansella tamaricis]